MTARDVPGDGEPEADAAGLGIARGLEAAERPQHLFAAFFGYAGSIIIHHDLDGLAIPFRADPDVLAEALRVV